MPLILRDASDADWEAVEALLRANHLPTAGFRESVSASVVACDGDALIGVAALEIYGDAALLRSVAVDNGWRGQGLGQQLTRAALDMARTRGVSAIYLLTTTAEAFFPKLGFTPVERARVPFSVQESVEFKGACPASAIAMFRPLGLLNQAQDLL